MYFFHLPSERRAPPLFERFGEIFADIGLRVSGADSFRGYSVMLRATCLSDSRTPGVGIPHGFSRVFLLRRNTIFLLFVLIDFGHTKTKDIDV